MTVLALRVRVTDEDLREGRAGDCYLCAHVLAIRRAVRESGLEVLWTAVFAAGVGVRVKLRDLRILHGHLPEEADRHVRSIDFRVPVGPIEYDLTLAERP